MADNRLDELRRRLEKDPGSRLFAQLAEQLRKEGELEEAIGVARTGLEKHPNYPSARLTLGRALLDSGDPAMARTELDAAVKGAPDNILASRLLGEALEELGELQAAIAQLKTTLLMAPGDPQIQARITGLEEQLAAPPAAPPAAADPGRGEHTKPMQAVSLDGPGVPPVIEPPAPEKAEGTPPDEDEEEDGGLPPTIRIRMPGDAVGGIRAPMPPIPGQPGPVGKDTTLQPTEPAHSNKPDRPKPGPPPPSAPEVPPAAEPSAESDQAPTLPGSKAAEFAGVESLPPTLPPRAPEGPRAGEAGPDPSVESPQPPETDQAPEPAEAAPGDPAVSEDSAPSPAPPGLVTAPAAVDARSDKADETSSQSAPGLEAPAEGQGLDFVAGDPAAEFTSGPSGNVTAPQVPVAIGDITTPPLLPESPEATRAPVPPESPGGEANAVESGAVADGEDGAAQPLSSATLAELYLQQGLLERAIEVYREVLEAEPGNKGARGRLAELEASLGEAEAQAQAGTESAAPASEAGTDDERAIKRQALERTIERLEALLAIVQRR